MLIAKSSQIDDFLTLSSVFLQMHSKILTNEWYISSHYHYVSTSVSLQRYYAYYIAKSSQMDEYHSVCTVIFSARIYYARKILTQYDSMHPALTNAQSCTLENPHKWKISPPSMILCIPAALTNTHAGKIPINGKFPHPAWLYVSLQLLQMHIYARKMENFLTQYDSIPPALTSAHTVKWKIFLFSTWFYASSSFKHTHAGKILTNGKFPHPVRFYASSSYKCTYMLEKFSQMENFLTQYDFMPPALTSAHTIETSSKMGISSPSMILFIQLYKWTYALEKSSQMENFPNHCIQPALTNAHKWETFLTQHDPMPPALTNAHTLEKSWKIFSPRMILCLQLLQMHTH